VGGGVWGVLVVGSAGGWGSWSEGVWGGCVGGRWWCLYLWGVVGLGESEEGGFLFLLKCSCVCTSNFQFRFRMVARGSIALVVSLYAKFG